MSDSKLYRVFVKIEDAGEGVYRPVVARRIEDDVFEIVADNEMPDDETWQFKPGERVRCKVAENPEGECLVAFQGAA